MTKRDDITQEFLRRLEAGDASLVSELTLLCEKLASRMKLPRYLLPSDIAQEVLLALTIALRDGRFRGDSGIRTFVYQIAVNTCISKSRELKGRRFTTDETSSIPDTALTADEHRELAEQQRLAGMVVSRMSPACKELWRMIFWNGMNYRQVAESFGLKESTVRERMWACRQEARRILAHIERKQGTNTVDLLLKDRRRR